MSIFQLLSYCFNNHWRHFLNKLFSYFFSTILCKSINVIVDTSTFWWIFQKCCSSSQWFTSTIWYCSIRAWFCFCHNRFLLSCGSLRTEYGTQTKHTIMLSAQFILILNKKSSKNLLLNLIFMNRKEKSNKPDGIPTYYKNKKWNIVNNINGKVYDEDYDIFVKECHNCWWRTNKAVYCPRCGHCM